MGLAKPVERPVLLELFQRHKQQGHVRSTTHVVCQPAFEKTHWSFALDDLEAGIYWPSVQKTTTAHRIKGLYTEVP